MLAEAAEVKTLHKVCIEPLSDVDRISATIRHHRIWPHVSDDGCPDADQFRVVLHPSLHFLGVYGQGEYMGLFMAHPQNHVTYEVHTCLLPNAWGSKALAATHECARWLYNNTPCQRIVTNVPEGNLLAWKLAVMSGMKEYGRNPKSLSRGGVLFDQILLGMSKGED